MSKLNKRNRIISKISLFLATFCLVFISSFGLFIKPTKAIGISILDVPDMAADAAQQMWASFSWAMDWFLRYGKSEVFNAAMAVALNTIAYDAATYIGSGGEGGKAFWRKENLGDYMKNIGDNAAGVFIEGLAKDAWGEEWDICEPDFDFKMKIGLGLVDQERPTPNCSFTTMKKNWSEELKSENFLTDFSNIFYTNDFPGYKIIKITSELNRKKIEEKNVGMATDAVNNTWQTGSGPSDENKQPPGSFADSLYGALGMSRDAIVKGPTEEPIVDALHLFVNQLAYTLFQRLIGNLGSSIPYSSSPYNGNYGGNYGGLNDYESDPGGVSPNKENIERRVVEIMSPDFSVKGDYNVLIELTICPDPQNAEVNHCVIGNTFRQAMEEKMTVIEAMEGNYINGDGVFGYKADGLEPDYKEAFPHRSILILKKYRIIPVGWDIAAQYIKDELDGNSVSLKDLIGCYEDGDEWETSLFPNTWCKGLVDPRWVLKAPINFCKREGYGPNFLLEDVYGKDGNSEIKVKRKEYCADEQTCIQETDDGKCEYYGYCIEDYRKWDFNAESCDPIFNTCQTFKSSQGKKISYLKNTLNYDGCNANSAGCAMFMSAQGSPGINNIASGTIDWAAAASSMYFNRNVEDCDEDKEGCHQFIRMGDKTGSNFIYDSSFEEGNTLFGGTLAEGEGYVGSNALQVNGNPSESIGVAPGSYQIGGQTYSLSLFAKCPNGGEFRINGQASSTEIYSADSWGRYGTTYGFPSSVGANAVNIVLDVSGTCLIDGIKLEKGREISDYSDYGEDSTIYQKLLPEYLEDDCYESATDYRFMTNAPEQCFNYGRKCNADEVGCKLYDEEGSNFSVPAQVTAQDYCPDECVGFDTYIKDETYFSDRRTEYLIPETGAGCSVEFAGCDEFTNLDTLEEGGEVREYYVELRQCV
ncbi:hypothetical protein K8R62_02420, partial [bacterium]|nr:hypothetical protein [bacterium]